MDLSSQAEQSSDMRRFLIATALIFGVFAPTADAQRVVARYRGGPGAGFGFDGPASRAPDFRAPGFLVPSPLAGPIAIAPYGPPPVRPGSYRDPLVRYRGVAPMGPFMPVLPFGPAPAILVAPPVIPGPTYGGYGGVEINVPGFRLSIPTAQSYGFEPTYPSEPVISAYPPPPGPAFDVASQLTEGVERLAASLNTIEDGDIWWDYLQIDALRTVTDNSQVTSDGSMTGEASATIESAVQAYRGVTTNGQLGKIVRLNGFAETRDALVVLSQSQSVSTETSSPAVAAPVPRNPTPQGSTDRQQPTLAPSPEDANGPTEPPPSDEMDSGAEGSIEELPAPPKIKI